ncbi:MAG: hypothetical protein ACK5EA_01605 [Planctomycetaceae bacterium]|jgi:hypothetical protein
MDATEIYILCRSRSKAIADVFLDAFGKSRIQAAADYPYPEFADEPEIIYKTPSELIERLEKDCDSSYSVYWDCQSVNEPEQVMLFFTSDGRMIVGIGGPKSSIESELQRISMLVDGEYGYVTSGSCPPDSFDEFAEMAAASTLPCVIEGRLRS